MLNEFLKEFKSVVMSTIDSDNNPFTSYAPYIKYNHKYYVFLSSMAKHWHNLQKSKKASLFFIEDEKDCENIFARKRVVIQGDVTTIEKDELKFDTILTQFENEHGQTVKMLRKMTDFTLFEITPSKGEAIFGFGEAYDIGGDNCDLLIVRKNLIGHHGHKVDKSGS